MSRTAPLLAWLALAVGLLQMLLGMMVVMSAGSAMPLFVAMILLRNTITDPDAST